MARIAALSVLFALIGISASSPYNASTDPLQGNEMWLSTVPHGRAVFNPNADYSVFRNVKDFGCIGDGIADDTACINTAISSGARCGQGCGSSTVHPAIIYFPSGTYKIHGPIVMFYFSQLIGNVRDPPTILADPTFSGMAMIDSNPYGDGGNNWYTNQNNFFRQVRNLKLDMTQVAPATGVTGIHWQVAQATSLVNIDFLMSTDSGTQHQGIWMENGSGGFMSDLRFTGGKYGMWVGNQQFLSTRMTFDRCDTAIYVNWNWQWSFKSLTITNSRIGIDMSAVSDVVHSGVGSILLFDSSISDTATGVLLNSNPLPNKDDTSNTLLLDNVVLTNVPTAVGSLEGGAVLPGGSTTITSWGRGSRYTDASGVGAYIAGDIPAPRKDASLLDSQGRFFERTRPQYDNLPASDFVSVIAEGAKGDGVTDDSDVIQRVINANVNGKVVYFPHGNYIIGKTVKLPSGTKIVGELWSVLMAGGAAFQDHNNPQAMIQVGDVGETGTVEITDIMFSTKGAQPGAILVQWNMKGSAQGAAGMWDSHFRVGGFRGSELQVPQCPRGQLYQAQCHCAHTLIHLTPSSSAYMENVWAWTADHDLDNELAQGQVSIYTERGVLIESTQGPVWMYGMQSEHNVLYQYQLDNAKNVFMTMIQSETPYWQPGPPAPEPAQPSAAFKDPDYAHCNGRPQCAMSYAIRAVNNENIYVYGAGMYNFFFNYDQTCLDTEDCQDAMVDLEGNRNFYMFNANTKAAKNMIVRDNTVVLAAMADNRNGFCQTINAFLTEAN